MKHFLFIVMSILVVNNAYALEQYAPTKEEALMLPEFCKQKINAYKTPEGKKKWQGIFGSVWTHMHHYCYALNFKMRSIRKRDKAEFKHDLTRSVENYNYVLSRIPPKHFFLPQILVDQGDSYQALKQYDKAIENYEKAIQLNKKLLKASFKLSRLYKKMQDKEKALLVLEEAKKYNPNSKALKKRIKRLKKS